MTRMLKLTLTSLVLCGAFASMGCFNHRIVKMEKINHKLEKYRAKKGVPEHVQAIENLQKVGGNVTVTLVSSENIGCTLVKTPDGDAQSEVGKFNCQMHDIEATDVKAQKAELKGKVDSVENNIGTGLYMMGFGSIASAILRETLEKVYDSATVNVEKQPAGGVGVTKQMHHYQKWGVFGMQTLYVTLTATPSDGGVPISVEIKSENKASTAVLGWGIPVFIIFFPIGAAIAAMSVQGEFTKALGINFIQAIEKASLQLAEAMSKSASTAQADTTWSVALSVH